MRIHVGVAGAALSVVLSTACSRPDPPPDPAAVQASLMAADRAFAAATAARGLEGWMAAFEASAIQMEPDVPFTPGLEHIRAGIAPAFADTSWHLTWEPTMAFASVAGDLGYTLGTWKSNAHRRQRCRTREHGQVRHHLAEASRRDLESGVRRRADRHHAEDPGSDLRPLIGPRCPARIRACDHRYRSGLGLTAAFAGAAPVTVDDPALARAAVAALIVPDPDAILLIRRAERAGDPWSGQMGLPGGRSSAGDADLLATAIRETREEVGIVLTPADRVGELSDVAPRSPHLPPLMVRPFVFSLRNRPAVVPNAEVAEHFWVDLAALLHPDAYRPIAIQFGTSSREFPAYHVGPVPVWGMTERILAPLVALLRQG